MSPPILPRLRWCLPLWVVLACLWPASAVQARNATAHIQRITTAVATLEDVSVQLFWPAEAAQGRLHLQAARLDAADLGYHLRDLDWRCSLKRDGQGGWRCDGPVRAADGATLQLSVALGSGDVDAALSQGSARVAVHHSDVTPDVTRIDLTRVPLAWTQAMLSQVWPEGRLTAGTVDSQLTVTAAAGQPLRIHGPLQLDGAALDTPDGRIAAQNLDARVTVDARLGESDSVVVQGRLHGGELLFGNAYVSLRQRSVALQVKATHEGTQGWRLPQILWRDDGILTVRGNAAFTAQAGLSGLDLQLHSPDLAPLRDGYLSTWLGLAGLGDLQLAGSADAHVRMADGELRAATLQLHDVTISDPRRRFGFDDLDGDVRFSASGAVTSTLQWSGGNLYGLPFGAARLPFASADGRLKLRRPVTVPILGGQARFENLQIMPPADGQGLDVRFGLALQQLDIGRLSAALGWPAFTGQLSGRIARAHYANDRLDFDGGLQMQLFGGEVSVSSLAMERPFGVAPTLVADMRFDDIGLRALTSAFDFGTVTGKLDGHLLDLRLVNWQPVAFDAWFATDRHRGVAQRISQRAVQDLSSVGDATFVNSLQAQLIGLFDDFGYSRIGIGCVLAEQVCVMEGLGSAGDGFTGDGSASNRSAGTGFTGTGFTIVEGSWLPHLSVIGFNRRVDWPTLVERVTAVGTGDVQPVVE